MIDRTIELAAHAARVIKETPALELMCEPQLSTVVFRYRPSRAELNADELNTSLRQRLFDRGVAVIGHTRVRNCPCLKFTCMNPSVTEAQMDALIGAIVEQGRQLESAWNSE
jgi:L-2,4-diaminobutyrate decarboxylase